MNDEFDFLMYVFMDWMEVAYPWDFQPHEHFDVLSELVL